MKQTKLVLATLAAAVFVTPMMLVACSKNTTTTPNNGGGGGDGGAVYEITFDANGGTLAGEKTQKTKPDGTLASLPTAARVVYEGHSFLGWYTAKDDGTGTKVTTSYKFSATTTTIYAHWKELSDIDLGGDGAFTITFHANNGTTDTQEITTNDNGYLTDGIPTFTYAEHKFAGWYTLAEGGDSVSLSQKFKANTDVYAQWKLDDGEEISHGPSVNYTDAYLVGDFNNGQTTGNKYRFQVTNPPDDAPDGSTDPKQYLLKVTFSADNTTFKIMEGETKYVHLQSNLSSSVATGGGYGNGASDITIVKAGTYIIYLKIYFDGNGNNSHNIWIQETDPELTEPDVHPQAKVNDAVMTDVTETIEKLLYPTQLLEYKSERVVLYAGETISFKLGNTAQKVIVERSSQQLDLSDVKNALDEVTVLKDGYYDIYLKMWNDGRWTVYGEKVADILVSEGDPHTVTFNANGGSVTTASAQTDAYGKLESLPAASTVTPPAGMKFVGWFTHATGGAQIDSDKIFKANTTVYAHYIIDVAQLTASFKVNGTATEFINNNENVPTESQTAIREYYKENVQLNKDDVITFTVEGTELIKFNTKNCHGVIKGGNKFTVYETGMFSIYVRYYEADDNGNPASWVIEMTDGKVDQCADGYYLVGSINSWAAWNIHKLDASGSITLQLEEGDEFKIAKVENNGIVWDDSYSAGSVERASKKFITGSGSSNIGIKQDGTYTITLTGGKITITSSDVIIDDDNSGMVPVVDDYQSDGHPNVYLIYDGDTTQGYFVEFASGNEYVVEVELHAGDKVAIYVPSWGNLIVTKLENSGINSTAKTSADGKYIEIFEDHIYTFYFKNESGNDRIWLAW